MRLSKIIAPAANPLRHEPGADGDEMAYAGYSLTTRLELLGDLPDGQGPVGLWNLIQMPHGGDLLVATHAPTRPRILFGDVDSGDMSVSAHLVRYAMRRPGEQKIAIRAVAATGRIGYLYPSGADRWRLVLRNVFVNPSGQYVDVPWDAVDDPGYAIQACNIHSELGSFSELEYHAPAIGAGTGSTTCTDVSQTWAFRGTGEAIERVTRHLLTGAPRGES
jgi:hypothetical protein